MPLRLTWAQSPRHGSRGTCQGFGVETAAVDTRSGSPARLSQEAPAPFPNPSLQGSSSRRRRPVREAGSGAALAPSVLVPAGCQSHAGKRPQPQPGNALRCAHCRRQRGCPASALGLGPECRGGRKPLGSPAAWVVATEVLTVKRLNFSLRCETDQGFQPFVGCVCLTHAAKGAAHTLLGADADSDRPRKGPWGVNRDGSP